MDVISRPCSACGEERLFEQPPCFDHHDGDCPERACAECGAAILIGPFPVEPPSELVQPAPGRGRESGPDRMAASPAGGTRRADGPARAPSRAA